MSMKKILENVVEKVLLRMNGADELSYFSIINRHSVLEKSLGIRHARYSIPTIPNDIIVTGRCVFFAAKDGYWNKRVYRSKEYVNPTFKDALVELERQIRRTGDKHHVFLEWIDVIEEVEGVKLLRIGTGS